MVMCARLHLPRESGHPTHEPVIPRGVITEKPTKLALDAYKPEATVHLKKWPPSDKLLNAIVDLVVLAHTVPPPVYFSTNGRALFEVRFARVE